MGVVFLRLSTRNQKFCLRKILNFGLRHQRYQVPALRTAEPASRSTSGQPYRLGVRHRTLENEAPHYRESRQRNQRS
ncbi:hypothetical protein HNQ49_004057 [Parapusillimonas granuli]|nr:hypothetical protein [Parapusillimonas granuli]